MSEQTLVCNLSVFTHTKRQQHMIHAHNLFAQVEAIHETNTGYSLKLPDTETIIIEIATFINDDRRCCPFIHFGMEIKPNSKGIYLLLSGNDTVKTAIKAELFDLLPPHLI